MTLRTGSAGLAAHGERKSSTAARARERARTGHRTAKSDHGGFPLRASGPEGRQRPTSRHPCERGHRINHEGVAGDLRATGVARSGSGSRIEAKPELEGYFED